MVTTTTAAASPASRLGAASSPRGHGLRSLCCEEIKLLPWAAVPRGRGKPASPASLGRPGMLPVLCFLLTHEVLPVTERDFDHRNSSSFDLVP